MKSDNMKESCLNCVRKDGCLRRSTSIFQLYIVTGRENEVPEAQQKMNLRASCPNWKGEE